MNVTQETLLIETATGNYPVRLQQIQAKTASFSFGATVESEVLQELGYEVVKKVTPPETGQYREDKPVAVNGVYTQVFVEIVKTEAELASELEQLKNSKINEVNTLLTRALELGCEYNFGTTASPDVQHIQLRDGDRVNLIGLKDTAVLLPGQKHPLRTQENNVLMLDADTIQDAAFEAGLAYTRVMKAGWKLKDEIAAATTEQEFPVLVQNLWELAV